MNEFGPTEGHIEWQDGMDPDGPAMIVFEGEEAPYMILPDIDGCADVPHHIVVCIAAWLKLHQRVGDGNVLLEGVREYLATLEEVAAQMEGGGTVQ